MAQMSTTRACHIALLVSGCELHLCRSLTEKRHPLTLDRSSEWCTSSASALVNVECLHDLKINDLISLMLLDGMT